MLLNNLCLQSNSYSQYEEYNNYDDDGSGGWPYDDYGYDDYDDYGDFDSSGYGDGSGGIICWCICIVPYYWSLSDCDLIHLYNYGTRAWYWTKVQR